MRITKLTSLKVWARKSLNESWKDTWKQVPNTINAHLHLKSACFNWRTKSTHRRWSLNLIQYLLPNRANWRNSKGTSKWKKIGAIADYPGPAITCFGVLWRTRNITIDTIFIQWDANKWRGILQFSQKRERLQNTPVQPLHVSVCFEERGI